MDGSYDEEHAIDEEEDMENAKEMDDEMNGDMDPYGVRLLNIFEKDSESFHI